MWLRSLFAAVVFFPGKSCGRREGEGGQLGEAAAQLSSIEHPQDSSATAAAKASLCNGDGEEKRDDVVNTLV